MADFLIKPGNVLLVLLLILFSSLEYIYCMVMKLTFPTGNSVRMDFVLPGEFLGDHPKTSVFPLLILQFIDIT
jgi:hypothetical protein